MSDKLRARARELAAPIATRHSEVDGMPMIDFRLQERITADILTGMREALREEPTEKMLKIAYSQANGHHDAWNLMAEARARGLE